MKNKTMLKLWFIFNPIVIVFILGFIHSIFLGFLEVKDAVITPSSLYFIMWFILTPFVYFVLRKKGFNILRKARFTGYIYVIKIGTDLPDVIALKVGKTKRKPSERLSEYKTGDPFAVILKKWKCYSNLSKKEMWVHSIAEQFSEKRQSEVFYFNNEMKIYSFINTVKLDTELVEET